MKLNFVDQRKEIDGIIVYLWWNIWKEQNWRTFQHEEKWLDEVAFLIKDDIQ
jgi:hypothetical protein